MKSNQQTSLTHPSDFGAQHMKTDATHGQHLGESSSQKANMQSHASIPIENIRHSEKLFPLYDSNSDGELEFPELMRFINDIYTTAKVQPPQEHEVVTRLAKHDLAPTNQLTFREIKRLLKDLSNYKTYNKASFSAIPKLSEPGLEHQFQYPQQAVSGKVNPTIIDVRAINPSEVMANDLVYPSLKNPNPYPPGYKHPDSSVDLHHTPEAKITPGHDTVQIYPLLKSTIRKSSHIFHLHDPHHNGHIATSELTHMIREVYALESSSPPFESDVHILVHKFNIGQTFSEYDFKRLLKQLSGHKDYEASIFKKIKNMFTHSK